MKNILFVCKYNRFRSKIAEAYFNKINRNREIKAKSAGLIRGAPINRLQKKLAKEEGIIIKGRPRGISSKLLKWQNMIVIVADDVPPEIFRDNEEYGKETVVWKIPDKNESVREIIKKVDELNNRLKKEIKE